MLVTATTWTNLKIVMLNERSQTKRSTYGVILFVYKFRKCSHRKIMGDLGMSGKGELGRQERDDQGARGNLGR